MATYNTAFGSLPGYNEMLGTTNTTGGGQQNVYGQRAQYQRREQTTPSPQTTFAQLQKQGMARPAPPSAPTAQPMAQYGGSQQAQQMRQQLQQQLQQYSATPSRFDTEAFKQIRGAQSANLNAEYQAQQKQLNEEMARRGIFSSSIAGGRMGDLAGQQARALATLDSELLQKAADTQAQDRGQLLQAGQGLAELAGSQDLAQFEANRVAQAAEFENQLRSAQFGQQQYEQYGQEALQAAQAEESAQQAARQFDLAATGQSANLALDLQRLLGEQDINRAQLTGTIDGQQTLAGRQFTEQARQFDIQQALAQQLGLGNLSVEQQRLAMQGTQFQQQMTVQQQDAAAERALREKLQTGELSSQERQQLTEIAARRELQTQQITEEARQFGLQLNEQTAARLYQGGFTAQQLAQEAMRITNQASQFGEQLTADKAQSLAVNALEQKRIDEAVAARNEQARQFNLEQSLRQALGLTEASGYLYSPLTTGTGVGATQGGSTLAREAEASRQSLGTLDLNLRRQLGISELAGKIYDTSGQFATGTETVGSRSAAAQDLLARNQLFMQLAQTLGTLTPAQIAAATQAGTTTVTNPLNKAGEYIGQVVAYGGKNYKWDGASWVETSTFL